MNSTDETLWTDYINKANFNHTVPYDIFLTSFHHVSTVHFYKQKSKESHSSNIGSEYAPLGHGAMKEGTGHSLGEQIENHKKTLSQEMLHSNDSCFQKSPSNIEKLEHWGFLIPRSCYSTSLEHGLVREESETEFHIKYISSTTITRERFNQFLKFHIGLLWMLHSKPSRQISSNILLKKEWLKFVQLHSNDPYLIIPLKYNQQVNYSLLDIPYADQTSLPPVLIESNDALNQKELDNVDATAGNTINGSNETPKLYLSRQLQNGIIICSSYSGVLYLFKGVSDQCANTFSIKDDHISIIDYVKNKYNVTVTKLEQNLLKGEELNLKLACGLTKKPSINVYSNQDISYPLLLPEFCHIYPFSLDQFSTALQMPRIYSFLNRLVTLKIALDNKFGYLHINLMLANEALADKSFSRRINYERLESLGDRVLKFLVTKALFRPGYKIDHDRRKDLVCNSFLITLGNKMNIIELLQEQIDIKKCQLGIESPKRLVKPNKKIHGDLIESLLGACYLTGSESMAAQFLAHISDEYKEMFQAAHFQSFDDVVYCPEQDKNQKDLKYLSTCEQHTPQVLGYQFKDGEWFYSCFNHRKFNRINLALLGDACIDLIVFHIIIQLDSTIMLELSKICSLIVDNPSLSLLSIQYELDKYAKNLPECNLKVIEMIRNSQKQSDEGICCSSWPSKIDVIIANKMLADIFEAVVGAIFCDLGGSFSRLLEIYRPIFEPIVSSSLRDKEYKKKSAIHRLNELIISIKCQKVEISDKLISIHGKEFRDTMLWINKKVSMERTARNVIEHIQMHSDFWDICDCNTRQEM